MVKSKALKSGNNQRSARGGSVEAEPDTKQDVENKNSILPTHDEDAIIDERELLTEESDSSDEADSAQRREYEKKEEDLERDGTKSIGAYNFEENKCSKVTNAFNVSGKYLVIALICFIISYFFLFLSSISEVNNNNINNNENNSYETRVKHFLNTIDKIKNDFPSQENILWKSLFEKIKYVNESRPTRPAIMILIYNNSKEVAECIAWNIGKAASNFLNTPGVIELIGDSNMNETDNELVIQYREPLKKNGVMIVYRLDEIPALVAQSFHSFCDTYNPLVERAVLLFTLDNSRLRNAENIKPTKKAMEVLNLLWRDTLVDAKLNSLITRLTDSVLEIHSEKNSKCFK